MFYHQPAAATPRGYHISLTWFWSTRARVTDSDQLLSAGFQPTAVLTFGMRFRRLNHSEFAYLGFLRKTVKRSSCEAVARKVVSTL